MMQTRFLPAGMAAWLLVSLVSQVFADSAFKIEIERKFSSAQCVSGYLLVDDKPVCYVLEKPWLVNLPEISSIPLGEYDATIRTDGTKGWRIELQNVPGRGNIQIHVGNTPADSRGCLLPGTGIDTSLCKVTGSKDAMELLKKSLAAHEQALQSSVMIRVKISGVTQ